MRIPNQLHLGYHYVRDEVAPGPNCSPDRLRRQVRALKDQGYKFMTCGQVHQAITISGIDSLPAKHVTLSFDDGLKDQFTSAFPILMEEEVSATFFVTTCPFQGKLPPVIGFQILINKLGAKRLENEILPKVMEGAPYLDLLDPKKYDATGRKMAEPEEMRRIKWMFNHWPSQSYKREVITRIFDDYIGGGSQQEFVDRWFITRDELEIMARSGMEIGSHTVSHPPIDVTGVDEIEIEIKNARDIIASLGNRSGESFAWTFGGKFRKAAKEIVARYHASGWNFYSTFEEMSQNVYEDLTDIPRVLEQALKL